MISKFFKYFIISSIGFIISLIIYYIYNQFLTFNEINRNIKLKKKFLSNYESLENIKSPLICFQQANEIRLATKVNFNAFIPLGSIPDTYYGKSSSNKFLDVFGFRNNQAIWNKKDNYKVLILGDSVVMSSNTAQKNIFSDIMSKTGIVALNLGCNGNGILSSSLLLEHYLNSDYKTKQVLFFINLKNDLAKDTMREYKTGYFEDFLLKRNKRPSLFVEKENYKKKYLNFLEVAWSKEINNHSNMKIISSLFSIESLKNFTKEKILNLFTSKNIKNIALMNNKQLLSTQVAHNIYDIETYILFLKILEKIKHLSDMKNIKVTFILVPGNRELEIYNTKDKNEDQLKAYWSYRQVKNDIMNKIASFDFPILDLYNLLRDSNEKDIFLEGHFTKEGHILLAKLLSGSLKDNDLNKFSKLIYYNSHFPSFNFNNMFSANFEKKLSIKEKENWLSILIHLYKQNFIDPFLYSPFLAYSIMNNDCNSISKFLKDLKIKDKNAAPVLLFKGICGLNNEHNINESIRLIKKSIELKVSTYFPNIVERIEAEILNYEKKI